MAFETTDNNTNNRGNGRNGGNDESWKAQGFVNLYLPTKEGGKRKVGSIPLRDSDPREKALRQVFEAEGEAAEARFLDKLIVEYNSATPTEGSSFDL